MPARLQWLHAMKSHAGWSSPDEDIAMFKQNVVGPIGAFETSKEKDALQTKGDRDDRLRPVAFMTILMQA